MRTYLLCLLLAMYATGCVSSGPSARTPTTSITSLDLTAVEVERRLQEAAEQWESAPHKLGGATLRGVDCSGLVQAVFDEKLAVRLPRTTEYQAEAGESVSRSSLQPGDLVFFRPTNDDRHVGIYLSDGTFLHASTSQGVTTSSLGSEYWTDRWWQARRVLSFSSGGTPSASDTLDTSSSSQRTGW